MSLIQLIKSLFPWGPVLFGVGFVAPLIAQAMQAAELPAPAGLGHVQFGLLVGLTLGFVAKFRGRWI